MNIQISYTNIRDLIVSNPKKYEEFPSPYSLLSLKKNIDYVQFEVVCNMQGEDINISSKEMSEKIWSKVVKNDKEAELLFVFISSIPAKSKFHKLKHGMSIVLSYENVLKIF